MKVPGIEQNAPGRLEESHEDGLTKETLTKEDRTEILAEYTSLRSEILTRIKLRYQTMLATLVILGTILTLSAQNDDLKPWVLLIYPILGVFLAITWANHDLRTGQIGRYIRDEVEPLCNGLNWESYYRKELRKQRKKILHGHRTAFAALGIFVGTQVVTLTLAILAILNLFFSSESTISLLEKLAYGVLVLADLIAIIWTYLTIRQRSRAF